MYSNSYDASLNVKNGFPVFSTVIEANSVGKQKDQFAAYKLTDEDRQEIHRLARDPRIGVPTPSRRVGSILPLWDEPFKQAACIVMEGGLKTDFASISVDAWQQTGPPLCGMHEASDNSRLAARCPHDSNASPSQKKYLLGPTRTFVAGDTRI